MLYKRGLGETGAKRAPYGNNVIRTLMIIAYSYYVLSKNSNHTGFITRRKKNCSGQGGPPFSVSLISTMLDLNKDFRWLEAVSSSSVDMRAREGRNCTPTALLLEFVWILMNFFRFFLIFEIFFFSFEQTMKSHEIRICSRKKTRHYAQEVSG